MSRPQPLPAPRLVRAEGQNLVEPFAESGGEARLSPSEARDAAAALGRPIDELDGSWLRLEGGTCTELADGGSALAQLYDLAAEIGISPHHSPAVMAEARAFAKDPGFEDPELEDLRHLPFLTIDEETSRDLDQALFVETLGDGDGHRVWYAIADAAHFVRPGSELHAEALRRGSTYYLPGLVLPMLPPLLSEDLVSLGPGVDRRALVFEVELGDDGAVAASGLRRALIKSRLKTFYDAVQRYYDGGPSPAEDAPDVDGDTASALDASLDALRQVGERRLDLAAVRDTIRLYRRELSVTLADDRLGFVAMADPRNDAERYNEQISLLCNVIGARFLSRTDRRLQPVFRFHQPPDSHRLRRFERHVEAMVRRHRLDRETWLWRRGRESLADFLARLPAEGPDDRVTRAIHRQAMLAGGRAGFDIAPGIHHGVGAEAYARFTAPMREIVGVFVHKEALESLGLETPRPDSEDEALREEIVRAAERSRGVQRRLDGEINRRLLDQLFTADLESGGPGRAGTVMGVSRTKVHVQLDDPPIDVKVYLRHLEEGLGRRLRQGRDGVTVRRARGGRAEWTVGEAVRIRPRGEDRERDRWRLELLPAEDKA